MEPGTTRVYYSTSPSGLASEPVPAPPLVAPTMTRTSLGAGVFRVVDREAHVVCWVYYQNAIDCHPCGMVAPEVCE